MTPAERLAVLVLSALLGVTTAVLVEAVTLDLQTEQAWAQHGPLVVPVVQPRVDAGLLVFEQTVYPELNRFGVTGRVYVNGRWHRVACPAGERCTVKWVDNVEWQSCPEPCILVWGPNGEDPEYRPEVLDQARKLLDHP